MSVWIFFLRCVEQQLSHSLLKMAQSLLSAMSTDRDKRAGEREVRLTTLSPDAIHSITRSLEAGCASADTLNTRLPVLHRLH